MLLKVSYKTRCHHLKHKRRERDSNPRRGCPLAGFQDRCLQPLSHLSNYDYILKYKIMLHSQSVLKEFSQGMARSYYYLLLL